MSILFRRFYMVLDSCWSLSCKLYSNWWVISNNVLHHIKYINIFILTDPCNNWPENYFERHNEPNKKLVKELYQYGRQNLALIHVMVQSPYVTKIKRDVAMSFITFVANSGGLLGLCIGFSFISAVELLYWICCICNIGRKKMFNKKVITQEPIVEEEIEDTKIETFVVEFISETIKGAATNQSPRKPKNKMPNVS